MPSSVKDKLEQLKNGRPAEEAPAAPGGSVSTKASVPIKLETETVKPTKSDAGTSSKPGTGVPPTPELTDSSKPYPVQTPAAPVSPAPKKEPDAGKTSVSKKGAESVEIKPQPSSLSLNEEMTNETAAPTPKAEPFDPASMKLRSAETCYQVPVDQIYDFPGHPFSVNYDEEMRVLEAKILRDGVQEPILLWPNEQKLYIVSGHRRRFICKKNGIPTIPAFIREMTRDEAIIAMVNGNEHREIPFTQRIKAYAMEMEAQKRQGVRNDLTRPNGAKAEKQPGELADIYGAKLKMSGRSFQRYMHIQYLSDDFCAMIDNNEMKGPVGIELSYLTKEQQNEVFNLGLDYDVVPSSAQAKQLHDLSESGKWTTKAAKEILAPKSREKGAAAEQAQKAVVFKSERIPLMFPPGTTQSEMESHILKMLELQKLAKRKQQEEAKKPAEEKATPPPEQGRATVEPEKTAAQKPAVSPKAPSPTEAPKPNPTAEKAEPGQKAEKPKETAAASPSPAAKDAKVVALPPAKQTEQKPKKNGPTR